MGTLLWELPPPYPVCVSHRARVGATAGDRAGGRSILAAPQLLSSHTAVPQGGWHSGSSLWGQPLPCPPCCSGGCHRWGHSTALERAALETATPMSSMPVSPANAPRAPVTAAPSTCCGRRPRAARAAPPATSAPSWAPARVACRYGGTAGPWGAVGTRGRSAEPPVSPPHTHTEDHLRVAGAPAVPRGAAPAPTEGPRLPQRRFLAEGGGLGGDVRGRAAGCPGCLLLEEEPEVSGDFQGVEEEDVRSPPHLLGLTGGRGSPGWSTNTPSW